MSKKMLIDATHEEETRVAVVEGDRLEEYDYESAFRKALKGNIYLAKVTRVEPSLQAAFVNFGGNRHGFLPFSEIHPDYFRIPVSDREALMAEQEEMLKRMEEKDKEEEEEDNKTDEDAEVEGNAELIEDDKDDIVTIDPESNPEIEEDEDDSANEESADRSQKEEISEKSSQNNEDGTDENNLHEDGDINGNLKQTEPNEEDDVDGNNTETSEDEDDQDGNKNHRNRRGRGGRNRGRGGRGRYAAKRNRDPEMVDKDDDEQRFRFNLRRKYKIQEVIKRGQIMLIQVSKEERGNKGAAVGSYLSLPGRYCVLMPNSPRAGGVSRKIANHKDRKKMRDMLKHLEVPKGMSVILRTAGVTRTKAEIKRDLDYLLRLWDKIRELTLESSAPALVYEEADLIKRAVRDLYTRDVEEIIVSGEKSFKTAKSFMKMMIPSHAKRVVEYKDPAPLFTRYHVENQINEMSSPTATMKSGGYLVINPTEALVSIDVNSGKATKERHIEGTALKTNLEAADEVARQLRLRDLGGLVVVDFIDMEDRRNNAKVERRLRDALSGDRARIQIGRISSFGLLELSRQRLNPSLTEAQYEVCSHCAGTGNIRTADATSVLVIRAIEEEGIKGRAAQLIVQVPNKVALYLLNNKRQHLTELEARYNLEILIRVDDGLADSDFRIELGRRTQKDEQDDNNEDDEKSENKTRRGRRGGRRRKREDKDDTPEESSDENNETESTDEQSSEDNDKNKRSRRGQSRRTNQNKDEQATEETEEHSEEESKPKRRTRSRKKKDEETVEDKSEDTAAKAEEAPAAAEEEKPKKRRGRPAKAKKEETKTEETSNDDAKQAEPTPEEPSHARQFETVNEPPTKKKKGWWNL